MKFLVKNFFALCTQSIKGWQKDNASVWCAALAYYTVFSLGPLLLLTLSIAGLIAAKSSLEQNLYSQLETLLGNQGTGMIISVIHHAQKPAEGIIGTVIGITTLILGAIGVFGQLQQMLNTIWQVKQKPKSGMKGFIFNRFLSFSMLGVVAFLLLVSMVISTFINGLSVYLSHLFPLLPLVAQVMDVFISFLLITVLFAFILKILPDVKLHWRNVWIGAALTALLFTIGKTVIGIYIGHSDVTSAYGASGSLIVLLLWVYYSSHILFLGTEFTKAYTLATDHTIVPNTYAELESSLNQSQHITKKHDQHKEIKK